MSETTRGGAEHMESYGRYRNLEFIGQGGMGRVYRAYDPVLNRQVALKLIRGDDPELARRLMLEARAQARIDHNHICKVFEVGEEEGKPFVAMQYIHGQSLKDLSAGLSLEKKVGIIREVAEAVHAAHRLGVIHRDIKPANIIVEQTEDGELFPYVLDFGLARELHEPGITTTGAVVGSPWYMSPEQARGEKDLVDRRSDVYSIGATLYELLCGRLPFESDNMLGVLLQLINEDPPSLRARAPGLPMDLEKIVMKCLEKDPARRYDSARALAGDLQRYLDGEPVQASRASFIYRLRKKTRKHKAMVAVTCVASVLILVLAGAAFRSWRLGEERARLAQEFGQNVERIEGILQRAYLLPLHDITLEKKLALAIMSDIEARRNEVGDIARGPASYALGKGYLLMQSYPKARDHLEQAWNDNYRTPRVAYALGEALGELYRLELQKVQNMEESEQKKQRKARTETEYRRPALEYLRASRADPGQPFLYVESLIAFYDGNPQEALQKAEQARKEAPWLYQALKLSGDIHQATGLEFLGKGDLEAGFAELARADEAYGQAIEMAGSDSQLYLSQCRLRSEWADYAGLHAEDPQAYYARAVESCTQALHCDPENWFAHVRLSDLYMTQADYLHQRSENPEASLHRALLHAERAVLAMPIRAAAHRVRGASLQKQADFERDTGKDPGNTIGEVIGSYKKAIERDPDDPTLYKELGDAYNFRAMYEQDSGKDPRASQSLAAENLRRALKVTPESSILWNSLGITLWLKADYEIEHRLNPESSLQECIAAFEKSAELNPKLAMAFSNAGEAYGLRARYEEMSGKDPWPSRSKALEQFGAAALLNPKYSSPLYNAAAVHLSQAEYLVKQGKAPVDALRQAQDLIRRCLALTPDDADAHELAARISILAGAHECKNGKNAREFFAAAEQSLSRSLRFNVSAAGAYATQANLQWHLWKCTPSSRTYLQRGLAAVEKALSLNPNLREALDLREKMLRSGQEQPSNF